MATWELTTQMATALEFDTDFYQEGRAILVDDTHFLMIYSGAGSDGLSEVFAFNTSTWQINTTGSLFEFDPAATMDNSDLAKIDDTHFLCAWGATQGKANVLVVDSAGSWTISTATTDFLFGGGTNGLNPILTKIDTNHFMVTYTDNDFDGNAVILEINTTTWAITTANDKFEYDPVRSTDSDSCLIDANHVLHVYSGNGVDGWAVVMEVNTTTWAISSVGVLEYDTQKADEQQIEIVDDNHFLTTWADTLSDGKAQVLTVNTTTWAITTEQAPFEFDTQSGEYAAMTRVDPNHYAIAWRGVSGEAFAQVLEVNTSTYAVTTAAARLDYDSADVFPQMIIALDSGHLAVAYPHITDRDGFMQSLEIEIPVSGPVTISAMNTVTGATISSVNSTTFSDITSINTVA